MAQGYHQTSQPSRAVWSFKAKDAGGPPALPSPYAAALAAGASASPASVLEGRVLISEVTSAAR